MAYKDPKKQRDAWKRWYEKNRDKKLAWNDERRDKLIERFREYKTTLKCSRCPETHPACLDFHHRDPAEKEIAVSMFFMRTGRSWDRLMEEIAKCEVLCANCHRKEHAKENGV